MNESTQKTGFGKSLFKVQGPGILKVCERLGRVTVLRQGFGAGMFWGGSGNFLSGAGSSNFLSGAGKREHNFGIFEN